MVDICSTTILATHQFKHKTLWYLFSLNFQTNFKVINTQPSSQVETNQSSVVTVYRNLLQHWLRTLVYKHGFLCVNAFFID